MIVSAFQLRRAMAGQGRVVAIGRRNLNSNEHKTNKLQGKVR
jgi:hypothetical protein